MLRNIYILIITALLLGITCPCFCEEIKDRWAVGAGTSFVAPEDAEFKDEYTVLGKATLGYGLTNNLLLELEGDIFRLKSKTGSKITTSSILMNLEMRTKVRDFMPYLLAGAGWSFFDYEDLTPLETKDKSNSYAYKLGTGIEYFLGNHWAVNCEAAHFYTDTGDGEIGKSTLDVYSWHYSVGLKYYF